MNRNATSLVFTEAEIEASMPAERSIKYIRPLKSFITCFAFLKRAPSEDGTRVNRTRKAGGS